MLKVLNFTNTLRLCGYTLKPSTNLHYVWKRSKPCSRVCACYSTLSSGDKYIQPISKLKSFHYQESLPRLPIPKLEDTCSRYLAAQKPLLRPVDYENTKRVVADFLKHEGPVLHEELVNKDKNNKHTSYISEPWFNMYLEDRRPVVLNHNPFMAMKMDPVAENNDQLVRATNVLAVITKLKLSLDDLVLEPDIFHLKPQRSDTDWFKNIIRFVPKKLAWYGAFLVQAFPLDMSQYPRLFSSTRIPQQDKDRLATFEGTRHVLVMYKGNFYTFDLITADKSVVPASTIYNNLKHIVSGAAPPARHPVGVLTSEGRNTWATVRQSLEAVPGNSEVLEHIDSALFVLCLDDFVATTPAEVTQVFLHGDGANRWFDKSFSIIIAKDGRLAVNFEHAWGDGVCVLRLFNEVWKETTSRPACTPETVRHSGGETSVRNLELQLTSEHERAITVAQNRFNAAVESLDTQSKQVMCMGKKYIKQKKLSPDAVMQLAFQIAHYRHKGYFVPTYESCSTAAFKHGRTETIRSASNATVACAESFDPARNASVEEMLEKIKAATDWHTKLTKEAAMGQGFDRHLFAMRKLAESSGKSPQLFQDQAYAQINHIILSTSTLSSDGLEIGGFAPVVPDGLGIGYSIFDDWLGCNVICYPEHADAAGFLECFASSVEDMHSVLEGKNFK